MQELGGDKLSPGGRAGGPDSVVGTGGCDGVIWVKPSRISDVCAFLKSNSDLDFDFLNSISAVDYINHFEVVYHLTSLNKRHTAIVKTSLDGREDLTLPSVYHLWRGADFQEREIWDLMGISFAGHAIMKRIMLWEGFDGHPLRKDYL